MRGVISTPNKGLKKRIAEDFKVYNIDEYRTSCLNNKTQEYCENMYLPDKKGKMRKMHSILTYEMENTRKGCINRDKNAVGNMVCITEQYLKDRTRPYNFRRDVKKEEVKNMRYKPKDSNPETLLDRICLY